MRPCSQTWHKAIAVGDITKAYFFVPLKSILLAFTPTDHPTSCKADSGAPFYSQMGDVLVSQARISQGIKFDSSINLICHIFHVTLIDDPRFENT